ncbi:hypothetical protein C8J55DRAFT_105619 [Lentinula edodes]|uniref:Peptidase A1 domain-containing protein n=1 Tax=Lentinula lateritia TaxID=40482 RepID=A0A9W9E1D0_9AGAR|nr:hypothetical protein C8J55DRAFT_105619 [Lentinula edodes]
MERCGYRYHHTEAHGHISSGMTLKYGPPGAVQVVFSKGDGAKLYDETEGFHTFPCDKVPIVSFSWGKRDKNFVIRSENFNLGRTKEGSSSCAASLTTSNLGLGNAWLISDNYMKGVYSSFRLGKEHMLPLDSLGWRRNKILLRFLCEVVIWICVR